MPKDAALYDLVRTFQDADEEVVLSTQQVEHIERGPTPTEHVYPYRLVDKEPGVSPPSNNLRIVGDYIERWLPIVRSWKKGEALGAGPRSIGWEVRSSKLEINDRYCSCVGTRKFVHSDAGIVHDACGRPSDPTRVYWNFAENKPQTFAEHVRGVRTQAMSDFEYDAFYATLPGNDLAHMDASKQGMDMWRGGKQLRSRADWEASGENPQYLGGSIPLRGGKEITGGRREYREHMKAHNMIHVDAGYQRDVDRAKAEREAKQAERLNDIAERAASDLPDRMGEI